MLFLSRRMGAQEGPSEPPQTRSGRSTFTGVGRTLTGEPAPPVLPPGTAQRQPSHQPDPIIRNIIFYRNGFAVDDGPLRRIDDPANAQFLTVSSCSIFIRFDQQLSGNTKLYYFRYIRALANLSALRSWNLQSVVLLYM